MTRRTRFATWCKRSALLAATVVSMGCAGRRVAATAPAPAVVAQQLPAAGVVVVDFERAVLKSDAGLAAEARLIAMLDEQLTRVSATPAEQSAFDLKLDATRAELLQPVIRAAKDELQRMTVDEGYGLVIDLSQDASRIAFFNPSVDVTEKLIRRINTVLGKGR
ncbi:MAG TPA: hypothetical protein VFY29_20660 [Terriglobia bacterium]|nr:hypothetical protein [Terriglobia bacterium]